MQYLPILKPGAIAMKNDGRLMVIKIGSKEWELRKDTLDQLIEIAQFVRSARHPTGFISGYEEIQKEATDSLWPEDTDDLP